MQRNPKLDPAHAPETGLRPPDPPQARRLNKMALVVVAVIMGTTLLAMALLAGGEGETPYTGEATETRPEPPRTGRPSSSFLDRPPQPPSGSGVDPFTGLPTTGGATGQETDAEPLVPPVYSQGSGIGADPVYGGSGGAVDPYTQGYPQASPAYGNPYASAYDQVSTDSRSPEEEALERALRSALAPQRIGGEQLSSRAEGSGMGAPSGEETSGVGDLYQEAQRMMSSLIQATHAGASMPGEPASDGQGNAVNAGLLGPDRHTQFLEGVASRQGETNYIATSIQHPISPFELREGTMLEAFLTTGIHSDLPGEVVAQVSRNVYDSQTQQVLLIPKGSRLVGTYDNQVALDQSRLLVAWTRLIFPDGRSVNLPGLNSKDVQGASGLTGDVNRHLGRAFGRALMLSVVGAGFQLSQPRPRGGYNAYPTPGEVAAGAVGTELSRVATEMLRRDLSVRPTIVIEEGTPFNVFLNGDLVLAPYYDQDGFLKTRQVQEASASLRGTNGWAQPSR